MKNKTKIGLLLSKSEQAPKKQLKKIKPRPKSKNFFGPNEIKIMSFIIERVPLIVTIKKIGLFLYPNFLKYFRLVWSRLLIVINKSKGSENVLTKHLGKTWIIFFITFSLFYD